MPSRTINQTLSPSMSGAQRIVLESVRTHARKSPGFPHPFRRSLVLCATGCRHGCLRETPCFWHTYCIEIQLRKRPSSNNYMYIMCVQYVMHMVGLLIRSFECRARCIRTNIVFDAGYLYGCITISNSRSSRESPVSPSPRYVQAYMYVAAA